MGPFVSIVVPTFNRVNQLKKCIALLLAQDYPKERFEIIIINDGSSDATEEYLRQLSLVEKRIRYKTIPNSGYSVVRNTGFRLARGEIIASLDDDCEVERDWLKTIVLTFQLYPSAAAVGGSVVNPYDSAKYWAQHILSFSRWLPVGKIRQMGDIPTCNIAYKRGQIKGFSFLEDGKSLYYRDSLFNLKLVKACKKIFFNPLIKVYHYRPDSGKANNDFYEYQKRYALGFVHGGYKAHGSLGKFFFKYRFLNLFCPRLIPLFLRCARFPKYLAKFVKNFPLILRGEWVRSKTIFLENL